VHRRVLARGDVALDPDEGGLGLKLQRQFLDVEVGEDAAQRPRRFGGVPDAARIGVDRGDLKVGRQNDAVAVENVGTALRPHLGHRRGAFRLAA
jgi:hypothetical protein